MMPAHPRSVPSTARLTPLANLADALTQRGHEARLIVSASFVAVRTPQGPDPFERIYLCDGRFRWAGTPAGGRDIASHDDVPRAAEMVAGVLGGGDPDAHGVATSASTISSSVYPPGGPAAEPGPPCRPARAPPPCVTTGPPRTGHHARPQPAARPDGTQPAGRAAFQPRRTREHGHRGNRGTGSGSEPGDQRARQRQRAMCCVLDPIPLPDCVPGRGEPCRAVRTAGPPHPAACVSCGPAGQQPSPAASHQGQR
jgi:hypothetical protein